MNVQFHAKVNDIIRRTHDVKLAIMRSQERYLGTLPTPSHYISSPGLR